MQNMNLTPDELRFLDQYIRELHVGAGSATEQLHQRGIFIDPTLFTPFTFLWDRSWRSRNQEIPYPDREDPGIVCPWDSKEGMEARAAELNRGMTGE